MTDAEINALIARIDEMAQRIGCRFVPDPEKLLAFRCAQQEKRSYEEWFLKATREIGWPPR